MRIEESYKKFGFFYLTAQSTNKVPGILSIKDGGYIELEVFHYSPIEFNRSGKLYRIIGEIEEEGPITLDGCKLCGFSFEHTIKKTTFSVKKSFIGYQYKENEMFQFNTFCFSVEGLHQWIQIRSGINPTQFTSNKDFTTEYKKPDPIICNIDKDIKLSFQFISEKSLENNINFLRQQITERVTCTLISLIKQDLEKFILTSRKIINFLYFAMDDIGCVKDVIVTSKEIQKEISGTKTPIPIKLYYSTRPFVKEAPKTIWPLFILNEKNMERVINNWCNLYDKAAPALSLYLSTQTGEHIFLEAKFLTLIQSLEAYHQRILCNDKMSIEKRLTDIMDPFQYWIHNKKQLIKDILRTRDYFTHYNIKENPEKIYETLNILYQKLEAIFKIMILRQLSFDDIQISYIISNNHKLNKKIQFIRQAIMLK